MLSRLLTLMCILLSSISFSQAEIQKDIDLQAQKTLLKYLKDMLSFKANFIQSNNSRSSYHNTGTFSFDKRHKFKLTYKRGEIPYEFTFDGKWLAQDDRDLEQISYVHKDDFPLAYLFDNPKFLMDSLTSLKQIDTTLGHEAYSLTVKGMPESIVLLFNAETKIMQGWQLYHQDGSITYLVLQDHELEPTFREEFFELPRSRKYH